MSSKPHAHEAAGGFAQERPETAVSHTSLLRSTEWCFAFAATGSSGFQKAAQLNEVFGLEQRARGCPAAEAIVTCSSHSGFIHPLQRMQQPFDSAAREALEATGLLTAEEVTLIIGRRKRAASRAAIAASLENTALLPTAEKPAERELTAVERNLRPPPPSRTMTVYNPLRTYNQPRVQHPRQL